jgi:hypothetical protein
MLLSSASPEGPERYSATLAADPLFSNRYLAGRAAHGQCAVIGRAFSCQLSNLHVPKQYIGTSVKAGLLICRSRAGDERRRNRRSARISTIHPTNLASGNNRRSGWLVGRSSGYVLDPLRELGQNSVERTGDGAAGGDPGERLPRDMAEPTVQPGWAESELPVRVLAGNQVPDHERGQKRSGRVAALPHHVPEPVKMLCGGPAGTLPDLRRCDGHREGPEARWRRDLVCRVVTRPRG